MFWTQQLGDGSKGATPPEAAPGSAGSTDASPSSGKSAEDVTSAAQGSTEEDTSLPVRMALGLLQFYRQGISPLMPSSCRFVPSCSEYSISSYKKFGGWRGSVLTAWRIIRCNPWGSSGFDPPAWPPKGLEAVYALPYSPEVSVVLGAVLAAWLVHGLTEGLFPG